MINLKLLHEKYLSQFVIVLRIILGATFILSGLVKSIDLWGFIYKIEQYLSVWNLDQPRSIVLFVATIISFAEFILGGLLLNGSYKRASVWILLLIMAFMLPLSIYIVIENPVSDCGCFGDFWIISNTVTLIKNILITGGLIYLIFYNSRVLGLYSKYIQWIQVVFLLTFISYIGYEGYSVQPLLDFRSYKIGVSLISTSVDESADNYKFVYRKDGVSKSFSIDELPDSSWEYVDRESISDITDSNHGFSIYLEDFDVTNQAITSSGEEVILIIPDIFDVNIAYTYLINEINRHVTSIGGRFIGLIATSTQGLERWKDLSLATYPLYSADDVTLKEISRGQMSLIYLKDGIIQWKRTIRSINPSLFAKEDNDNILNELYIDGKQQFIVISSILLGLMILLWIINRGGYIVKWHLYRKKQNKSVTLQKQND